MLIDDWKTFVKSPIEDVKLSETPDQNESHFYACITPQVIDDLKNMKASKVETYVAQRTLCGDDIKLPTKKLEFEIAYKLVSNLSDVVVFKHQENILNFHCDMLLEFKNYLNRDIPSIVVEVDEDGHKDRLPEMEKFRQNVIEYFNNRFIRIKIDRNASKQEINKVVEDTVKRIKELSKELALEYTIEIDEEDFINKLQDYSIDKAFVSKFLKKDSTDKVFKYTHQEIGEFIGFPARENYQSLVKKIKGSAKSPSVFIEGVDWKKSTEKFARKKISEQTFKENQDGRVRSGGHNKQTLLLTRQTFNRLCIVCSGKPRANQVAHYFAKVYELAMDYLQTLRIKNIKSGVNTRSNHEQVKKRVKQLVEQNTKKTSAYKMEQKIKELTEL